MEYLYGLLSSISRDLACGAVNQLRYPCCFNTFVEELEKEERNLIATRNSVKDRSSHAKKQTRKTAEVLDKWLENAQIDVHNVSNLLNEARTKNTCCFGHCPNWIWRYNLGKKLSNKKKELENFIKEGGQYIQLERVATLPSGILDFSSEKYLSFGSRQKAYEELMEAVKDDEVGMIGLYGIGGCGKTTMAMEVLKKAEAEHLFGEVIFVPVSSTVEVRRIQDKIASSLQYTFPENEERERAKRLCMRLTQEDKILVILDDVWQTLDFGAIGIPSTEHHKGCKVLITTRSEDVCTSNDCQKKIQLQILTNEEAWALFQKQAHVSESTSVTVKDLARRISDECKGLPVAIAAVASTLKGKDEVRWKVALNKLTSSKPINIEKGLRDPYKCLELSYDNLDDEEAKSLLLLCSVFPEDEEIPIEFLAICAIGLGVVGEVRSYEEARDEVIAAKIKLVSCCLLLDASHDASYDASDDEDECVKMHDLVRDVAHLIAKNEKKGIIKCAVENDLTLEQNSVRYLWCEKLPNDLDCSNLEFLWINTQVEVLDESFTRMGKLRFLCLYNEGEDRLPLSTMSFKTLSNIRCLILSKWKLSDISFVRDMKKLESLSLYWCSMPSFLDLQKDDAVTQLTKLKLLVLFDCEMERNILEVIGKIPQLEELCFFDKSEAWDGYSENTIELYKTFSVPQTLQRYTIALGSGPYHDLNFLSRPERTLVLGCFDKSNEAIVGLAKKANKLYMRNVKGDAKNIIPNISELEGGGMPDLNVLEIRNAEEIECLVDSSNHTSEVVECLFSSLKRLYLGDCPELKSLLFTGAITLSNPVRYTIFQNLHYLKIVRCRELKYVFSANTIRGLPQLESLKIRNCDKLEQIVEDKIGENTSTTSPPLFNHTPELYFPKLKEVNIGVCHKLKRLFSTSACNDLPNLEILKIYRADELEELIGCEQGASNNFQFQHIKTLEIVRCAKLEVIFPVYVVRCLPELEYLYIEECKELKHITEEAGNDRIQRELKLRFPKLKEVYVVQCHKLKRLFSASASDELSNLEVLLINGADELEELVGFEEGLSNAFQFQHLKTLEIIGCAKLEVIFPVYVVRCLLELECLNIKKCKELKHIMEEDENDKIQRELKLRFPKLKTVAVRQCHKLKRLFSRSACNDLSNLGILIIDGAHELEELIWCEQGEDKERGKAIVKLPQLKLLIFMHLLNLCQGIELCAIRHCIIDNCPKLSLTSTTSLQELCEEFSNLDFSNLGVPTCKLELWIDDIKESNKISKSRSTSESPSSQSNGSEVHVSEVHGSEVHGSEVHATATSTNSELNGRPSLSTLHVCQHETHSEELVNRQSSSGSYLKDQHKPLGEIESTIAIPQDWDSKLENTSMLQMNQEDPSTSKCKSPCSQVSDSNQSILGSIPEMVREHKQIQNEVPVSTRDEFLELERKRKMTAHLQLLEQNLSFVSSPYMTKSIDEIVKLEIPASVLENIEEIGNEIILEGSKSMRDTIKTLSTGVESISLGSGGAPTTETSGRDILTQHYQVVDQELSLVDKKEGIGMVSNNSIEVPPGVVPNEHIVARINEGPEKEFVAKISTSEILTRATSLKNSELVERSCPSYLDIPLHKTHSNSESESHPKNIEDFGTNDITSLFQPVGVEEHGEGQVTTSSIVAGTADYQSTKDNRVVEVLAELEKFLKMPLRDIASSKTYTLHLLTAINFLYGIPFKDATLSDGLEDIIDSMHKEFPSILCSFKQSFVTTHKLTVLEAQRNKGDISLVSKISEVENLMDEAHQKEAVLKERIIRLKKEINDCEAALSSLQEENKKRGVETIGYKKELENMRKDKSQMVEDQRKVEQELLEVTYKWSVLCSKFELNRIVGRDPS